MTEPYWKDYVDYDQELPWHLATCLKGDPYSLYWAMALEPKSILEVGAGSGRTSILMKRLLPEARVVATDIDPQACGVVKRLVEVAKVDVEVQQCDLLHLPYRDQHFDVCHSSGVMEHLAYEEVVRGLDEQLRVARAVIVGVPLVHWFLSGLSKRGDELVRTKVFWVHLFSRASCLLDFCCTGPLQEEEFIIALLSRTQGVSLPLSLVHFIKSEGVSWITG